MVALSQQALEIDSLPALTPIKASRTRVNLPVVAGLRSKALADRSAGRRHAKRGRAMGGYLRQLVVLSSVAAKRRKFELLAASCLVPLSLGLSEPAVAQNCTPVANGVDLTAASPSTSCMGTFNTNINYGGPTTGPSLLTVTLNPGVVVVNSPGGNAVNIANITGPAPLVGTSAEIIANDATITNTINSGGTNQSGLRIQAAGSATITSSGTINVTGANNDFGILAIVQGTNPVGAGAVASVTYNNPSGPGITVNSADNSGGIQAINRGNGNAIIDFTGNITGVGSGQFNGITGLFAGAGDVGAGSPGGTGDGMVRFRGGTVDVRGNFATGIYARSGFPGGSAIVVTDPGTTVTVTNAFGERAKPGIALDGQGTAADQVTATVASTIQMLGPAAADPSLRNLGIGIRAFSFGDAPISVNLLSPGSILTQGGGGIGIAAVSLGGGSITVDSSAPITTQGPEAHGIWASSTTGPVVINAANVSTTGQFSAGINAISTVGGNVTVNIPSGGSIMGGWQPDVTSVGPVLGLPAAGVILSSTGGTATLTNNGSIGALSDRAVAGDPQVIN